jgi:hypothetical protein
MPKRRPSALSRLACIAAFAVVLLVSQSAVAWAIDPGLNGWYWPLGHDHTSSGGSWLGYRTWYADSPAWHVAFDDIGRWKDPVYAAADGVVLEARSDVGGYGPGAGKGGAVVVSYRTADGTDFKALYGHVESLLVAQGQNVIAGQVIAYLNNYSPAHVHFGINLGAAYPAPSAEQTATNYVGIWMGHSHESTSTSTGVRVPITYGWTDPMRFLASHTPSAPPLPGLSAPKSVRRARVRRTFTATGYLAPRHRAGARSVLVSAYRLEGGVWILRGRTWALNYTSGSRTRYVARLRLTRKGRYVLRASVPGDTAHAAASSNDWSMTVR